MSESQIRLCVGRVFAPSFGMHRKYANLVQSGKNQVSARRWNLLSSWQVRDGFPAQADVLRVSPRGVSPAKHPFCFCAHSGPK